MVHWSHHPFTIYIALEHGNISHLNVKCHRQLLCIIDKTCLINFESFRLHVEVRKISLKAREFVRKQYQFSGVDRDSFWYFSFQANEYISTHTGFRYFLMRSVSCDSLSSFTFTTFFTPLPDTMLILIHSIVSYVPLYCSVSAGINTGSNLKLP